MSLKSFAAGSKRDVIELDQSRRRKTASPGKASPAQYPSTTLPRIAARVSERSERRIRELALQESTRGHKVTVQDLIVRGLSQMFVERGLPPLEEASDLDVSPRRSQKRRA